MEQGQTKGVVEKEPEKERHNGKMDESRSQEEIDREKDTGK